MILAFLSLLALKVANASTIDVTVKFSNSSLNAAFFVGGENRVFGLNWYTCLDQIGTEVCPGAQATFQSEYFIRTTDNIGIDTWKKTIDVGSSYIGPVVFDLFAPLTMEITVTNELIFSSSVSACFDDTADYEMSGEICGQHGQPWTVDITSTDARIDVEVFPAFGIGETGNTSILLPHFYSTQLDNYRDIPVYVPPSVLQNKVKRPLNIMIVLDGGFGTVQSYSTRTGFEANQIMGVTPESIMIGITTVEFAYQLDFDQRTYELSYEKSMNYPNETCISGSRTGGSPLMLEWLDEEVIPAVLAKLGETGVGMERGEVSITGGSMGGLTSCYAAAARPDVFKRAVCSSPSNCYNYAAGGLASIISSNYYATGVAATTVIQFLGQEVYDEDTSVQGGDEDQLGYLLRDDEAWQSIGLTPLTFKATYTAVDSATYVTHPYETIAPLESDHVVMSLLLPAGQHAPSTWEQEFAAALPNLYRANRPDKLRVPKSESLKYLSVASTVPTDDTTDDDVSGRSNGNDDGDDAYGKSGFIALIVVVVVMCIVVVVLVVYVFYLHKKLEDAVGAKSAKKDTEVTLSPMNRT
jgi:pimeloyl-ACP methyl ester carboxylesterase